MELKIKAIHCNPTDKLNDFIARKLAKLEKNNERIQQAEVTLKVVKPESVNNKEVSIHLNFPGGELHTEKVCDTFEEGVDLCLDGLMRQMEKQKDRERRP